MIIQVKESAMPNNFRDRRYAKSLLPVFLALVLSACSNSNRTVVPGEESLVKLGLTPLDDERQIPDISFLNLENNQSVRLQDFRGSVVLLNFWASWCPPCRAEMPSMERLNSELKGSDFVMVAVNVQEDPSLIKSFLREYELDFPIYMDPDGSAAREIGVTGLPTSILIDRKGRAFAVVTGALEWDSEAMLGMMKDLTS
jgi:thiol-disulfide isomerase/thioredoxin